MMIKQRIVHAAMSLALISASTGAAAESAAGWYFGATGGQAQVDIDQAELDAAVRSEFAAMGYPVTSGTSTLEDSDTSWSIVGGYRFSPNFSIEGSYMDFGAAEYRATGTVNPPGPAISAPATAAEDIEASGFTAAVVGTAPIGEMFELHARAGVMFTKIDVSATVSISGSSGTASDSLDSQDFFFGLGAGLHFAEQWALSLDWQRFKDVGDEDETGEADIDRISLGLTYRL
jgi:OmpA-OmpF porin, OOP family